MIISIDYDGTIVKDCWPYIGPCRFMAIPVLKRLKKRGHKLILNTCRENHLLVSAKIDIYKRLGFKFDAYNTNLLERTEQYGGDCRKISADLYLDDRAFFPGWLAVFLIVLWMEFKARLRLKR